MRTNISALAFVTLLGVNLAHGAQVRWINPQGGSFDEPANWSPTRVPLASDTPVFDLAATYTVTFGADRAVQSCIISDGEVTLDLNSFELTATSVTCTGGAASVTGGTVHGRAISDGGTLHVLQSAEFDRGGAALSGGELVVSGTVGKQGDNAGFFDVGLNSIARVTATGAIVSRGVTINGTFEVEAGQVFAEVLTVLGRLDADGGVISGPISPLFLIGSEGHLYNGAVLAASVGAEVNGSMHVQGQGSNANVKVVRGLLRVEGGGRAGAASTEMSVADQGRVEVGPGGTIDGPFYRADSGTLRLEPGSSGPTGGLDSYGFYPGVRLEVVIDAIATPRFSPRGFRPQAIPFEAELAGDLSVEVRNSNALRIGDRVELLTAAAPVIGGDFNTIAVPTLHGRRALELIVQPTQVVLEVVSGGTLQCWSADFNGDGDVGNESDIAAFFACLGGNCCPTCAEVDFDADGDLGTDADIESFFRVLTGFPC